jgi:ABC-2 type transport system ATP-binding protein
MSGLDPLGRRLVSNLILEMKAQGKTVFFSTHILSDAETLCDGVGVLRGGRLLAQGRLDEILNLDVSHLEVLVSGLSDEGAARLAETVTLAARLGERHRLHVAEGGLADAVRALEQAGARVLLVQPVRQSLEEFFFKELGTGTTGEPWQALD